MPHKNKAQLLAGVEGLKSSKVIGCNTLRLEYVNGTQAIRYHNTDVITTLPNGRVVLNTGGWKTSTTKQRFNDYTPFKVHSERGIWYVREPATGKTLPFSDGITFTAEGKVVGKVKEPDTKKIKAIKKQIAAYVKLVDNLPTIPFPDNGDCWYCLMHTQDGKALGDSFGDLEHIKSHVEDGYIFGSIIFNALKEKGYREPALIMQMGCRDSIKNALRRYLTKRLLPDLQAV